MIWKTTIGVAAAIGMIAPANIAAARASDAGQPTCSDNLDIDVHGQHVVGDYVTGIGHDELGWPARGREVGAATAANGGAAVPGGPGPGFHFDHDVAPGASFCTDSRSPGAHF